MIQGELAKAQTIGDEQLVDELRAKLRSSTLDIDKVLDAIVATREFTGFISSISADDIARTVAQLDRLFPHGVEIKDYYTLVFVTALLLDRYPQL